MAETDAMIDLLEREKAAILSGRFDVLERLETEKARLMASLPMHGADATSLRAVRSAAERNAALLGAMAKGIRRAQTILSACRAPVPLVTYGRDGQREETHHAGARLARKA